MVDCMSFQRLQLHFDLVLPSFTIVGVGLQPHISWYVHYFNVSEILIIIRQNCHPWKTYIISTRIVESVNIDWVVCSGSVGESMGTGWVLLRQLERDLRASKFYATKYSLIQCKYWMLGTSLHIVAMDLQHLNCLYIHCAGSGVLLVSLRCLFVV